MRFTVVLFIFCSFILGRPTFAQVQWTSPLPFGILQVHGNHADMRVHVSLGHYSSFSYKLSSNIDTSNFQEGWYPITVQNGAVDTLITVPSTLLNYAIYWRTGLSATDTGGVIADLTPGHILGVAGQSNAQGFVGTMTLGAMGDIRMLTADSDAWQVAHEPTGGMGGGPWIVASNILYQLIGDTLPIGIVNTAVGGTGLTVNQGYGQWLRNPNNPFDTSIYGKAIARFRSAGSELEWLTWIQGEADAGGQTSVTGYRNAFAMLMSDFEMDLEDSFQCYHLQIGGRDSAGIDSWPNVREAERILPPSTMVGTAVGWSVVDGLHYTDTTLWAVGKMFAGAILSKQYSIATPMYPPLLPDASATLDSMTDGSIPGKYCFSVRWTRDGVPVKLKSLTRQQYFGLTANGLLPFDTSLVSYRIAPDSTRALVWLRTVSIPLADSWTVTYDDAAESDRAPIATIDSASGDTIYATAFAQLPVVLTNASVNEPLHSVPNLDIIPNPASNSIAVDLSSFSSPISIALVSETGATLWQTSFPSNPSTLSIDVRAYTAGCYFFRVSDSDGTIEKKFIIRR